MTIPQERKIRRQELWLRDERLNELIQRKAKDSMRAVADIGDMLKTEVENAVTSISLKESELGVESQAGYDESLKKLTTFVDRAVSKINQTIKKEKNEIDVYIKSFTKSSNENIDFEMKRRLDSYKKSANLFHTEASIFRKGVAMQMTKYQKETMERYAALGIELNKLKAYVHKKLKK